MASARRDMKRTLAAADTGIGAQQQYSEGGAQLITGAITGNYPAAAEGAMGMYKADDAAGVYG